MALPEFTVGIEEEYQIIDPESRELTSYIQEFLEQGRLVLEEQIQAEFLQSQVEVGSRICKSLPELRDEVVRLRRSVAGLAEENGLRIAAASTHPFSQWVSQQVTAGERYTELSEDIADVGRRMLIFGTHIHVGISDRDLLIDVMNQARYFLPHILALSTSSPFFNGRKTGFKSYRSIVFEDLPRTGIPPSFNSWADYQGFVDTLRQTRCIKDPSTIWWDMRPHHRFPTLEFRIADIATRVDEAVCIGALCLAITAKLVKLRQQNRSWRQYRRNLITENKWRAVRYGIDGHLIDFGKRVEIPMRDLAEELLELVSDVVEELGIEQEISHVRTILKEGTSADRQIAVHQQTGSLEAVVDHLIEETREGLSLS